MRYTTFYNIRDYDSFCNDTNVWEKKLQDAFKKIHMCEPKTYPAVLVWELVWWPGSTTANFSYMYIYRDSQLVKDLFSDLNILKQEARENKRNSKRKKI